MAKRTDITSPDSLAELLREVSERVDECSADLLAIEKKFQKLIVEGSPSEEALRSIEKSLEKMREPLRESVEARRNLLNLLGEKAKSAKMPLAAAS